MVGGDLLALTPRYLFAKLERGEDPRLSAVVGDCDALFAMGIFDAVVAIVMF